MSSDEQGDVEGIELGADARDFVRKGSCSMERALGVVGKRTSLLMMREAYYGTRRFDDFAARVGITDAVTSERLRELVASGLLERHPYREPGRRTRHEYRLTQMGVDLLPAAIALMQWGDKYLSDAGEGPVTLRHSGCGARVRAEVRCEYGHEVSLGDITVALNPTPPDQPSDHPTGL
ncbi:winged helix-turn-helix transcriptional regulator [Ruicaihuangia caeni]|uniref:winged helix-turn-helix transcriptional regulator n=1 Tax=Ruicaihuangia caeni TaxID=3042517 RepID=UPI00338F23DC